MKGMESLLDPQQRWWSDMTIREERSAASLLQSEAHGGRRHQSVYDLFAEMELKDGHLHAVLQTRLNGLLGLPQRLHPAKARLEVVDFAESALAQIPRFDALLRALLDALPKGFAAIELLWDYDRDGRLIIGDWIAHPQEFLAFDAAGQLQLRCPPFRNTVGNDRDLRPAPPRKFLVLRHEADARHPYGCGLCLHAYWPYWFKKNALRFWAIANERHGAPTAVARYGPGLSEEDHRALQAVLANMQSESGVVLPESIQLSLLEAQRGDGSTFQRLLDWCNDELSKIVLGATLTSGEGRRSGSLALGSIHELVRQDYIEADARLLASVINEQLLCFLIERNFKASEEMPRWQLIAESPQDLNAAIEVDRRLLAFGVPLAVDYFHQRYGRPAPTDGQALLRYDDANFYQYHLQFGVLTINEVRSRLSLPPVPWGDRPTAQPQLDIEATLLAGEDTGRPPR